MRYRPDRPSTPLVEPRRVETRSLGRGVPVVDKTPRWCRRFVSEGGQSLRRKLGATSEGVTPWPPESYICCQPPEPDDGASLQLSPPPGVDRFLRYFHKAGNLEETR